MKNTIRLFNCFAVSLTVMFNLVVHAQFWTNGLVAFYPFNGNANNVSGNGLNATINGGVTLAPDRFGTTNSAYQFNGTAYMNISDPSGKLNFDARSNSYSVTLWVFLNVTNAVGGQKFICDRYNNSPCSYDIYYDDTSHFRVDIWDGGTGSLSIFTSTGTSPRIWHQIAFVVTNRLCKLYLDGIENDGGGSTLGANVGTTKNSDGIRQIGSDGIFSTTRLNGIENNIRIYNRALSSNDVQILYQYESGSPQLTSAVVGLQLGTTNLVVGGSYQIQTSTNLITWINYGAPFIATSTNAPEFVNMINPQGFFRILVAP